jgi:DNA-binding transcriptional ArsR family regulator
MRSLMTEPKKLARIFKALSVETRVQIIIFLKEQTLCVNALAARLEISPAAVSQHLRVLRDADLVVADKKGYWVHYRVNEATLAEWKAAADGLLGAAVRS